MLRGGSWNNNPENCRSLIVTIMMRASTTTTTVFVLSVVLRALFYSRTGGWEFVGRV